MDKFQIEYYIFVIIYACVDMRCSVVFMLEERLFRNQPVICISFFSSPRLRRVVLCKVWSMPQADLRLGSRSFHNLQSEQLHIQVGSYTWQVCYLRGAYRQRKGSHGRRDLLGHPQLYDGAHFPPGERCKRAAPARPPSKAVFGGIGTKAVTSASQC